MSNPLLAYGELPAFSSILPEHIEPALDQLLAQSRAQLVSILEKARTEGVSVENFLHPLAEMDDQLEQMWSPVSHLNAVANSDALRDAYNACLPKLSEYSTEMGQHKGLFEAFSQLKQSTDFVDLTSAQQKVVDNALRDFTLSGIDLESSKQVRFGDIKKRLSELGSKYSENVLDATHAWSKLIGNASDLDGLPASSLAAAKQAAEAKSQEGYLLTLDIPCYLAVITYCENRSLRQEMYTAYTTRASEEGPFAGEWDNNPLMNEILALKHELSQLLGFNNYAERSIATKMTTRTGQVFEFLNNLAAKSLPAARAELFELQEFAQNNYHLDTMFAWDLPFYSEKLKQEKYAISQEALRPWFPYNRVLEGMFTVASRLFDVSFEEVLEFDSWHSDVRFFNIVSNDDAIKGEKIASFYLDVYARQHKRGGAWMADCKVRRRNSDGSIQLPVAFLTCNFNGPVGDAPALLTHNEVTTLFHEFGHGLHHMLTQVEESSVSGINGVAWDAVELPSQFMENWCWEKEAIPLMSGHYETGDLLPADMLEKMLSAKNFQSAMQMVRQLEFSLFDFSIHCHYQQHQADNTTIHDELNSIREQVAVITPPEFNRFECSFSHIFAGGYAAGYYSYKWAEVLSADAFSLFEENGIFDVASGQSFKQNILHKGGSEEPMDLFVAFRGREPSVDALLRHSGLTN
ncbi:oligopeptidase A [Gammaproteobacteria bacterium 45_16_T64]|nr:oligopeptidase A [Gammaproteobacteria bacterium 45_16_T64]